MQQVAGPFRVVAWSRMTRGGGSSAPSSDAQPANLAFRISLISTFLILFLPRRTGGCAGPSPPAEKCSMNPGVDHESTDIVDSAQAAPTFRLLNNFDFRRLTAFGRSVKFANARFLECDRLS